MNKIEFRLDWVNDTTSVDFFFKECVGYKFVGTEKIKRSGNTMMFVNGTKCM